MKITNQHDIRRNAVSVEHKLGHTACCCQEEAYIVTQPFSEKDIIYLQELFLTNGWHHLKVKDLHAGRSIISTLLYSLNYYHDIACLTVEEEPLDSRFFDVYAILCQEGYLDGQQYYDFEEFFIDHFYADFLWIEYTSSLQMMEWYNYFLQTLCDLNLEKHIPIIFLSYEKS